jgi:hypothetical protein
MSTESESDVNRKKNLIMHDFFSRVPWTIAVNVYVCTRRVRNITIVALQLSHVTSVLGTIAVYRQTTLLWKPSSRRYLDPRTRTNAMARRMALTQNIRCLFWSYNVPNGSYSKYQMPVFWSYNVPNGSYSKYQIPVFWSYNVPHGSYSKYQMPVFWSYNKAPRPTRAQQCCESLCIIALCTTGLFSFLEYAK